MFLNAEEVHELTGKSRAAAQARVLRSMGIEHRVRPDGAVLVMRSHVEKIFGGRKDRVAAPPKEPNWAAVL